MEDIELLAVPNQTFKFKTYDVTIQMRKSGYYFTLKEGSDTLVNALFIKPNINLFAYNNKNNEGFYFEVLNNDNIDYTKFNLTQFLYYTVVAID